MPEPRITLAIKPTGYKDGAAYTYLTLPQARHHAAKLEQWIRAAEQRR